VALPRSAKRSSSVQKIIAGLTESLFHRTSFNAVPLFEILQFVALRAS
jgi:hypothetical protein